MTTFAVFALGIYSIVLLLCGANVTIENAFEIYHDQNTNDAIKKSPFSGKALRVLLVHVIIKSQLFYCQFDVFY